MRSDVMTARSRGLAVMVLLLGALFSAMLAASSFRVSWGVLVLGLLGVLALIAGQRFQWTIPNVSLLLWVILLTHRAFIFRFDSVDTESLSWSPLLLVEILVTVGVFAATVSLFLYRFLVLPAPRLPITLKLLLAYTLFAGISLIYTPSIGYTGVWLLRLASAVLLMTVYFGSSGPQGVSRFVGWTLFSMLPYLAMVWVAFLTGDGLFGESGSQRVRGYWIHPGQASIIAYSAALAYLLQRAVGNGKMRHAALALLCFGAAFLAGGKTAALAAALVLAAVFLISWRRWMSTAGVLMLVVIVIGVAVLVSLDVGLVAHWSSYSTGDFGTVQARLNMWEGAFAMFREAPFLGHGFAATRIIGVDMWKFGNHTTQVHNSYLETLVGLGLLGGGCLFLAIGVVLVRLIQAPLNTAISLRYLVPAAAAWLVLVLSGFGDLVFGGTLQPSAYLFLGLTVSLDVITMQIGLSMAPARRPAAVSRGRVPAKKATPIGVTTQSFLRSHP